MANTITLKRRISSVRNTKQITKAMELVAASKMRRAQDVALSGREYREAAYSLLARFGQLTDAENHPLFAKRDVKTRLYIVISSNRGLAGAYNSNVLRLLSNSIKADRQTGVASHIVTIGNKAANFVRRLEGVELIAAYPGFDGQPSPKSVRIILNSVIDLYKDKSVDDAQLIYTMFKSNLVQNVTKLQLLPARFKSADDEEANTHSVESVTFEPDVETVINNVAFRLLEAQLWQAILESTASEHSMRMIAMKNATDNASDLIDDLTLAFNTARQAAITQELAEITGGAEAMK